MALHELIEATFRRGCGISVESAMSTPLYRKLKNRAAKLTVEDPAEFALVQYLGECLADRAAQNIPQKVKNKLYLWDEGIEAQQELLATIMEEMSCDNWRKRRKGTKRQRYGVADSALPAATRSWERGSIQPNCLGVAQMLVGFARQVGAEHYLINVLKTHVERALESEIENIDILNRILSNGLPDDPGARKCMSLLEEVKHDVLVDLHNAQNQQAHHALAIKLADGTWWILDPYLISLHQLRFELSKVQKNLERLNSDPRRVVMLQGLVPVPVRKAQQVQIARRWKQVNMVGRMISLHEKDELPHWDIVQDAAWVAAYHYVGELRRYSKKHATPEQLAQFEKEYSYLMSEAVVPEVLCKHFTGRVTAAQTQAYLELYRRCEKSIRGSKRRSRIALYRMLRATIRQLLREFWQYTYHSQNIRHGSIEITDPATMLGCATLNHMRIKTGMHVQGRLSVYTRSQWVLLDTYAAQQRGDTPDAESAQEIQRAKRQLQRSSRKLVLPNLQAIIDS